MALAAPLYGALVALAVLYKLFFGSPYSPRELGVLSCLALFLAHIPLGHANSALNSLWARFLHLPDDIVWCITRGRPFNYDTILPGKLVLGRLPRSMQDISVLEKKLGVSAVVTMNEPWETFLSEADITGAGLSSLVLPTPDYNAPSLTALQEAVAFTRESISRGEVVFVHCNGGKGRSSVVVIAYLMQENGWTKEAAYSFVKSKRKIAKLPQLGGIMPQWRVLAAFEETLSAKQD